MLSNSQKKVILQLAKDAIKEAVLKEKIVNKDYYLKNYPWLKKKGAVFVTINEFNNLRGCIGSIIAHQSLFEDIVKNAKAAALNDPRFRPVSKEELNNLEIEVSLLSEPKLLKYKDISDLKSKIRVGVDGVILNLNGYQATYLPSVWEQLPSFELFFKLFMPKSRFKR
jgi:AmmeMemoRadiSam system protein A